MNWRDRWGDDERELVAARVRALREQGRTRRPGALPVGAGAALPAASSADPGAPANAGVSAPVAPPYDSAGWPRPRAGEPDVAPGWPPPPAGERDVASGWPRPQAGERDVAPGSARPYAGTADAWTRSLGEFFENGPPPATGWLPDEPLGAHAASARAERTGPLGPSEDVLERWPPQSPAPADDLVGHEDPTALRSYAGDPTSADDRGSRSFRGSRDWGTLRERFRLDPGRRGLLALAGVVVVVGAVTGGWMLTGQPGSTALASSAQPVSSVSSGSGAGGRAGASSPSEPAGATSPSGAGPGGSGGAGSASPGAGMSGEPSSSSGIVIDVAGQVSKPGVYTLPSGSRVEDALRAAGGPLPGADLSMVNRARVLSDGEQIAVGVAGAASVPGASGGGSTGAGGGSSPGGVVDLNTADLTALDTLPGVGPVLAQHIVDWRSEHGRFSSVDDLQQVSGIGPSKFAEIKDLVRV